MSVLEPWLRTFQALLPKTAGVRRAGAAVLDLAYVAAGRLDGFWEMGLKPWDMAAGALLVREAGGLVADFSGEQNYLKNGNIIAANTAVFDELRKIVNQRVG
jgi:myo-inositol-1(or 4)-monophosphatase